MAATGWQHRPVPIEKHFSIMLQRANTLLNLLIETDKCKLSLSEYLLVKNIPIVIYIPITIRELQPHHLISKRCNAVLVYDLSLIR